jgi:putative transposase
VGKDAPVVERMKELSAQYPRYGYCRIRIFLGRGGYCMSPGRPAVAGRRPAVAAQAPEEARRCCSTAAASAVWFYDFVFDGCANGQQLKCDRRVHQGGTSSGSNASAFLSRESGSSTW